jgi:hypothetical protein
LQDFYEKYYLLGWRFLFCKTLHDLARRQRERLTFAVLKAKIIHNGNHLQPKENHDMGERSEGKSKREKPTCLSCIEQTGADGSAIGSALGRTADTCLRDKYPRFVKSTLQNTQKCKKNEFYCSKICI